MSNTDKLSRAKVVYYWHPDKGFIRITKAVAKDLLNTNEFALDKSVLYIL